MKEKSFFWWVIFIPLCIWQLPQLLVGLIMWPFVGKKKLVADRHFNFCWKGEGMSGGISLGPIAYVSERASNAVIAHETDGHTFDSKLMGPLYLLIIGIPSFLNAAFDFTECYYDFYPERWANKHAKLKVSDRCILQTTPETIIQNL